MKEKTIKLITMIGIWVAVILLSLVSITLVKNVKEITTDPMIYGMEKHNFKSCTCYYPTEGYTIISFDESKINGEGLG